MNNKKIIDENIKYLNITGFIEYNRLIALAYFKEKNPEKALEYLNVYSETIPDNIEVNWYRAALYGYFNDYKRKFDITKYNIELEYMQKYKSKALTIIVKQKNIKDMISFLFNIQCQTMRSYNVLCLIPSNDEKLLYQIRKIFNYDRRFIFIMQNEMQETDFQNIKEIKNAKWLLKSDTLTYNVNILKYIVDTLKTESKEDVILKHKKTTIRIYKNSLINETNIKELIKGDFIQQQKYRKYFLPDNAVYKNTILNKKYFTKLRPVLSIQTEALNA